MIFYITLHYIKVESVAGWSLGKKIEKGERKMGENSIKKQVKKT